MTGVQTCALPIFKVQSAEQLRKTARGLTKDGKASGSRTMFVCDQKDLVLGRAARERALNETTERLDAAELEVLRLEGLQATLSEVRKHLSKLREPVFDAQPLAACAAEIDHARRSLSQLDLTEVVGLEGRLAELVREIGQHEIAMQRAHTEAALADDRVKIAESAIHDIDARRDSRFVERERQIQRLKLLCEANPEKNVHRDGRGGRGPLDCACH